MATRLGDFIRSTREEQEMSITDLAADTPVTSSTIGNIENGDIEVPSMPVLRAIAQALGVAISRLTDLLPEDSEPRENVQQNMIKVKGSVAAHYFGTKSQ